VVADGDLDVLLHHFLPSAHQMADLFDAQTFADHHQQTDHLGRDKEER